MSFETEKYSKVRVAAVQYEIRRIESFEEFALQCRSYVKVANNYSADFIVFPELFTLQLFSLIDENELKMATHKLTEYTPKYLELFSGLASEFKINIIGGSQFTKEEGNLFNTAYLFHRNGAIDKQHKIHITPGERKNQEISGGDKICVFQTDKCKIAIFICYDIEFPELARMAISKGAQILFNPSNTDQKSGYLRVRYCAQARCIENHTYVVLSGCIGNSSFFKNGSIFYSQSAIFTPLDTEFSNDGIAAEAAANSEYVIVSELDLQLSSAHRQKGTVNNWVDRRKDLYQLIYEENDESYEV